jgi:hypothetical protein
MSDKLLSLTVRGRNKTWCFTFYGDTKHLDDWRDDGLEISQVVNVIPVWVANLGLVRQWCFLQDIFNFKWPFAKKAESKKQGRE